MKAPPAQIRGALQETHESLGNVESQERARSYSSCESRKMMAVLFQVVQKRLLVFGSWSNRAPQRANLTLRLDACARSLFHVFVLLMSEDLSFSSKEDPSTNCAPKRTSMFFSLLRVKILQNLASSQDRSPVRKLLCSLLRTH